MPGFKGNEKTELPEELSVAQAGDRVEDADDAQLSYIASVQDQTDLERAVALQAGQMLTEQADERDDKRILKTQAEKQKQRTKLRKLEDRLLHPARPSNLTAKSKLREEIVEVKDRIEELDNEVQQIKARIVERHANEAPLEVRGHQQLPNESRRDFLIRTGKITPFSNMAQVPRQSSNLADVMLDVEADDDLMEVGHTLQTDVPAGVGPVSHRNLRMPGFVDEDTDDLSAERASKRRKVQTGQAARSSSTEETSTAVESDDPYVPDLNDKQLAAIGDTDDEVEDENDDDFNLTTPGQKRKAQRKAQPKPRKQAKSKNAKEEEQEDLAGIDDGNEKVYKARLESWIKRRSEARRKAKARKDGEVQSAPSDEGSNKLEAEEWHLPHPSRPDAIFENDYRIPGDIYPSLFDYQKTGVQWLQELRAQEVGGIIGDEMGLGKTIQVISYLAGLHYSNKITKPTIIVCPATVMKQWVNEFHRWWPPFRVSILHTSGSGMLDVKREDRLEQDMESQAGDAQQKPLTKSEKAAKKIVDKVKRDGHILVTTYAGLQTYRRLLIPTEWEYAVLDEGHKIRNPNAGITIFCKELRTANRLILSGTPMQNNLTELWSLFDFVSPMRLGTLVDFRNQFEYPIKTGGYANASNLQVETAMRCAEALKETISGYLLQRFKVDVAADLPKKSERVLFCQLTRPQREAYEEFLASPEANQIAEGNRQALYGIDILRKICNHPDLLEHKNASRNPKYGRGSKSGKMQVVKGLLQTWKKDGHKTLLFAQNRITLDILEKFIKGLEDINLMRMDGTTAIKDRQTMVDKFNTDPDQHVFLLTTKVGGLGVNLTGADRVIIYDPDWNPSTDIQARERAWRLGQKREVEIYRLLTTGTIEEKIYHRQIFKQFLTDKVLRDPKQRQTFDLSNLHDLFTLGNAGGETETGHMFKGTEVKISDEQSLPKSSVDLSSLPGISRNEAYQTGANLGPEDENPVASAAPVTDAKDDRLLNTIFARAGVCSSIDHDSIVGGSKKKARITADPEIISREARRVADEAARELQRYGETARSVPIGTPTWTGVVGTTGRPEPRGPPTRPSRGGIGTVRGGRGGSGTANSSVVLVSASSRQAHGRGGEPAASASSRDGTPAPRQLRGREFIKAIRDFIATHGGEVNTQMLINQFDRHCGTPQRKQEFTEMLGRVAVEKTGVRGRRSKWILKAESNTERRRP
ncbi:hypothetical protein K490DRAFT_47837 [Saccharata proteae CBS 121410]|uniref:DNA repair and recombination protein RAD26 n=1 Tax=Saccharata proteae CBS 121410 TaxID=1314787 RepID=A0A9P4HR02_9PEZI|nr:hypothetical protein K490DRAFT_47837 [Saccharata proteae CBS 121410]